MCEIVETTTQDVKWIKKLTCHTCKSGIGLEATMSRMETDRTCKLLSDTIVLHCAFRAALKKQLTVLHDGSNLAAVLYHGAPGIGKSSLALATAYYLALAYGSSCIVKFQHNSVARSDIYEGILKRHMSQKCVIFDQINTNVLHPSCLTVKKQRKEDICDCLPFTFFTSGDYPPPRGWTKLSDSKRIHYRVIDMVIQEQDIKDLFQDCEASETLCSHIKCISGISASYRIWKASVHKLEAAVKHDGMEPNDLVLQALYGLTETESSELGLYKEFWILWPSFFRMNKSEQRQRLDDSVLKTSNFLISQEQMQYLSLKLSQIKSCGTAPSLKKVLSWFVLVQNNNDRSCTVSTMSEFKVGYVELENDQYSYNFANVNLLRHMLEVGCRHYSHGECVTGLS
ncbi:uncharacterized protein LOC117342755 isoform X2 [Pecten maximus]|nr:uncharacterized protein LOC117342755 isoform X2 [Pecten maximus]